MKRPEKFRDDVSAPGPAPTLVVGTWYVDRSPAHDYKEVGMQLRVLKIGALTVHVESPYGDARTVNRLIFESQMRLSNRQAVRDEDEAKAPPKKKKPKKSRKNR